ncbi:MAG: hypothetical protein IJW40_11280 [Clostridia bacterium]|nr:hypothetical protein [Clostridia bacterium]
MTRKRTILLSALIVGVLAIAVIFVTIADHTAPGTTADFYHTFSTDSAALPDVMPSAPTASNPYASLGVSDALFQAATDAWSVHTPQPITADDGSQITLPYHCYTYSYVKSDSPRVYTHVVLLGRLARYPNEYTEPLYHQLNGRDYKTIPAMYKLELYRTPQVVIYDPTDGTYTLDESDKPAAHVKISSFELHKDSERVAHVLSDFSVTYKASPDGLFGKASLTNMQLQPLNPTNYALLTPVDANEYGIKTTDATALFDKEVGGVGVSLDGVLCEQGQNLSMHVTFAAPADSPNEQLISLAGSYTVTLTLP